MTLQGAGVNDRRWSPRRTLGQWKSRFKGPSTMQFPPRPWAALRSVAGDQPCGAPGSSPSGPEGLQINLTCLLKACWRVARGSRGRRVPSLPLGCGEGGGSVLLLDLRHLRMLAWGVFSAPATLLAQKADVQVLMTQPKTAPRSQAGTWTRSGHGQQQSARWCPLSTSCAGGHTAHPRLPSTPYLLWGWGRLQQKPSSSDRCQFPKGQRNR